MGRAGERGGQVSRSNQRCFGSAGGSALAGAGRALAGPLAVLLVVVCWTSFVFTKLASQFAAAISA